MTNASTSTVTELDAATGKTARVLAAPDYGFDTPGAVACTGSSVWVANSAAETVTAFPPSSAPTDTNSPANLATTKMTPPP